MKAWFLRHIDTLIVFIATFIMTFAIYLYTLAPTVTFEDSGELIAAAYHLGVPHPPGYPLFTFTGRIFCMLPLEPAAYCMNIMSAFFGALASGVLACAVFLILSDIRSRLQSKQKNNEFSAKWMMVLSVTAGLMFAFAFETWEQSIITEVYALHHFLIALMLLSVILWNRTDARKDAWFGLFSYLGGLSLGNHHLTLAVLPAFYILFLITDRQYLMNVRRIIYSAALFVTGLTVYLYLPVASSRDPVLDWGNPENWINFKNTILRMQYQVGEPHTWTRWIAQMAHYGELLLKQWPAYFLSLAVIGGYLLNRYNKKWFLFGLLYLSGSVFLTVYATNFHVRDPNPVVADENRHLVSVFYTASYLFIAFLSGIGGYQVLTWIRNHRARIAAGCLIALIPLLIVLSNFNLVNMREYRFAEQYAANLFRSAETHALILTNYDPHYFSTFYYQHVEGIRPDLTIVDIKMLETTWYLDRLKILQPELINQLRQTYSPYRERIEKYERGQNINSENHYQLYSAFINGMIDYFKNQNRRVYLTFDPPETIGQSYIAVSNGAAIELIRNTEELIPANLHQLNVGDYLDDNIPKDRMARFFKTYYGRLILARAIIEESLNHAEQASAWYDQSYDFLKSDPRFAPIIREGQTRVGRQNKGIKR